MRRIATLPAGKLERWADAAKHIHAALKEKAPGEDWPCLKTYLTGTCGFSDCKTCTRSKSRCKGSEPARAVAKAALAALLPRMTDELKKAIKAGEQARRT